MTGRDCIVAVLSGRAPDRIPAVWRLDKWHSARAHAGDMPAELAGMSLEQVEDHLGLGRSARAGKVFRTVLRSPVTRTENRRGDTIVTEYHTPAGTLRRVCRYAPGDEAAGLSPGVVEYPIRDLEHYAAFEQIARHTEYVPTYDAFLDYDRSIGGAGLPLLILGPNPIHELLMNWTGYETGYLHLADGPDAFLSAARAADEARRRMWPIVAASPARFVMHGVNFDTGMTPPPVFREHFLPYLRTFNDLMHESGKWTACHADGDMTALLALTVEAGYDAADCFACAPLVRCTFAQAREAWKDHITIWGGLPSTLLEPTVPLHRLREHLESIYAGLGDGRRFMIGLSDQAMPTSSWEHIKAAAEFARCHSTCTRSPST
ncbi:MAG TPA: uroporphyrinogen decarboxylase family protein [Phycisphaerae bacterium]|nr:uroporphyrinogen decarboxylase family protein [Phycisphaerae bacterium]